jgi:TonB family protein
MRYVTLLFALAVPAFSQDDWRVQKIVAVAYHPLAQQARIEGTVELLCDLEQTGAVIDAHSGHSLLQKVAVENARRWTFVSTNPSPRNNSVKLTYVFRLLGDAVRGPLKTEFWFEFPNRVEITSQIPCMDHAPCNAEELEALRKSDKKKGKRAGTP